VEKFDEISNEFIRKMDGFSKYFWWKNLNEIYDEKRKKNG